MLGLRLGTWSMGLGSGLDLSLSEGLLPFPRRIKD